MVGSVGFTLDAPDGQPLPPRPTGVPAPGGTPVPGANPAAQGGAGPAQMAAGALPPHLPCASDPGSYTEVWMRQTSSTSGQEMSEQIESWLDMYANLPVDYASVVDDITAASDWVGFLTVLKGNAVSLVHSLGQFRTGLGTASPGNGRTFGLLGERLGRGPPPIIMVPSAGGLAAWIRPIALHEPSEAEIEVLKGSDERTIQKPTVTGDKAKDEDPDHPRVEVTNLCFIPKAWAAYFLDQCTPYDAYQRYKRLLATIPVAAQPQFRYLEAWFKASCLRTDAAADESMMTAKWQAPMIDRKVHTWMERHTQYVNAVPFGMMTNPPSAGAPPRDLGPADVLRQSHGDHRGPEAHGRIKKVHHRGVTAPTGSVLTVSGRNGDRFAGAIR